MNASVYKLLCRSLGIPEPVAEFEHIPGRKFRLDLAWPEHKVGIEVQGGIFLRGKSGHKSIKGVTRDMEKDNLGLVEGWAVLKFTPQGLHSAHAFALLEKLLSMRYNHGQTKG